MRLPSSNASGNLLLVDDDVYVVRAVARLLRPSCARIFTALSGELAVAMLATHDVDVIVSDTLTPPLTGFELFRRARQSFPDIATILLSGSLDPDDLRRARHERILHAFISKPWDNQDLVDAVRTGFAMTLQARQERESPRQAQCYR